MKIITLHCEYIKFKPLKKAFNSAPDLSDSQKKEITVPNPLVVLTAVESSDSDNELNNLIKAVTKTASEVKTKNIVLYPYAHLSSNLANPDKALNILKKAYTSLSKQFKVTSAPFGYYKQFELKCKGHPLSELSKQFPDIQTNQSIKVDESSDFDPKQLLREISRSKLDTSKLKDNDHRILGQKLDLFSFNEASPGSVFWHPNGFIIYNELLKYIRSLIFQNGYKEISTPLILDNKVWKISGHWDHYKENMFISQYESRDFAVRPMNCPGAMLIYKSSTRSYKDLPLKLAEFGIVHRKELSGVLSGLFRVIKFTQDDAHIFCTKDQLKNEIEIIFKIMKIIFKDTFNLDYHVELSTRPKNFLGDKKDWDLAENSLETILKKLKINYKINKGDGAFYGPKIDLHLKDSLGRNWQCNTTQLDMQMPKRFGLKYIGSDNKEHTPFVIHRTIIGSLERFIGILLEHYNGRLPLWLSPIQVRVINFTDRNLNSSKSLIKKLIDQIPNLRIDSDFRSTTINDKIRESELQKIPISIVIGDKEEKSKTLSVRERGSKPKINVNFKSFINDIKSRIENKTNN